MIALYATYVLLFVLAGLLGVGIGWILRQFLHDEQIRLIEADLRALRQAGGRAEPNP